jgi:hypothetical protein
MKVTFHSERYYTVYSLGIEVWFPQRKSDWKRLELTLLIGPWNLVLTLGSRKRYDEITALLKGRNEDGVDEFLKKHEALMDRLAD